MPVADDPRKWSNFRKNFLLFQVSFGTMIGGLSANIQTPAVGEMQADLPATAAQISLSLSLFILLQGIVPLFWSAISEVKGRKFVYIVSMAIYIVGSVVVATSKNIGILLGFRCFQAAGSSAVMSIGAATLADIYDPVERGTKMGIYYIAPLLGPSLGSILGGGLTTAFTWRGPFYFLAIMGVLVFMSFLLFFRDTFRHERSLTYQNVLKERLRESKAKDSFVEEKAGRVSPTHDESDLEKQEIPVVAPEVIPEIELGLMDVNPLKPMAVILSRKYNLFMLFASGLYYAFAFVLVYTTSRSLDTHYHLDPLKIGFVLVAYGIGTILGSIMGGRWSDHQLSRIKSKEGGVTPEMRLKSTVHGLVIFPLCVVGYAWVIQERVNLAGVCAMLFACGFTSIFVYTSTLAYIVDSNVGRSSSAVALNSFFRCTLAFIFEEIAVPMQDGLGDGWMYTIIAFIMGVSGVCTAVVMFKGEQWRKETEMKQLAA
ncbi:major facilitator superfamily domain-containing protein [Rhodocollybia butyracea]|uniref:Major facilitator superfamily domain-containing protein n=1 Tax=Rhodocollybia butyracea TaxID=206335 RepID=A0A9P5U861_9AGAR|nr:major facilitator superfamily domain-containing protein [Rhodocollybia butyracea]